MEKVEQIDNGPYRLESWYASRSTDSGLVFSTFLGGSDDDFMSDVVVDNAGNIYMIGTSRSVDFPTGAAMYPENQSDYSSPSTGPDVVVTKFDPSGENIVFSTYFGGMYSDNGFAITLDDSGNLYLLGNTDSTDFPTFNAYQKERGLNHTDYFITKLDSGGSTIIYSTYLGGSEHEGANGYSGPIGPHGILVDYDSCVWVAGESDSLDFPTFNAIQPVNGNTDWKEDSDIFISKLGSAGDDLLFSTYFGGNENDAPSDIAMDHYGYVYITGATQSSDFPTKNALQPSHAGCSVAATGGDAFIIKVSPLYELEFATYLGGSDCEHASDICLDNDNNILITGATSSSDFPTMGAYKPDKDPYYYNDLFITKIDASGSTIICSTFFGGSFFEGGGRIETDLADNVYLSGLTQSTDFPTLNAVQLELRGFYSSVFLTILNPSLQSILFSTYLGGSKSDYLGDMYIDYPGNVYLGGGTTSTDWPVKNAFQETYGGPGFYEFDGFVARIFYEVSEPALY